MTTELINKIVWQCADNDTAWYYALCPTLGVNMFSFQVMGGYHARDGQDRASTRGERAEVGRRLIACWNACAGIDTQHLESYGLPDFAQKISDLAARRDQLLKALESIEKWDQHTTEFSLDWGSRGVSDLYRGIARDAIAACQPAPAVVHLPSDDTEGGEA